VHRPLRKNLRRILGLASLSEVRDHTAEAALRALAVAGFFPFGVRSVPRDFGAVVVDVHDLLDLDLEVPGVKADRTSHPLEDVVVGVDLWSQESEFGDPGEKPLHRRAQLDVCLRLGAPEELLRLLHHLWVLGNGFHGVYETEMSLFCGDHLTASMQSRGTPSRRWFFSSGDT